MRTTPVAIAAATTAHWMFGNLYEELVFVPPALVRPQPGALAGPLEVGSPLWYYGPTLPVAVATAWVAAAQAAGDPPVHRRTCRAALAITVAAALKVALITKVNPGLRDPTREPAQVRSTAAVWLVGNGVTVVALAAGLVGLLARWRGSDRHGAHVAPGQGCGAAPA